MFTDLKMHYAYEPDTSIYLHQTILGTEYIIRDSSNKNLSSVLVHILNHKDFYVCTMQKSYWDEKGEKFTKGENLETPTRYLNNYMQYNSKNSQKSASNALRKMFTFLALFNIPLKEMNYNDCLKLVNFLYKSVACEYEYTPFDKNPDIDAKSVSNYISAIRNYLSYLGFEKFHPMFFEKLSRHANTQGSFHSSRPDSSGFDISVAPKTLDDIRAYIKQDEYFKLREFKPFEGFWADTGRLIIDLMMLYGLRIGEVLSLTLEDVYVSGTKKFLILRNRALPKNSKYGAKRISCKNLPVVNQSDYTKKANRELCESKQKVEIDDTMFGQIMSYIDKYHKNLKGNVLKRYINENNADRIADYVKDNKKLCLADVTYSADKKNHYLFINSNGSRLLTGIWNSKLKTVFEHANVPVDVGVKSEGLNHRFRHGFAMMLCRSKEQYNQLMIMSLMRHTSLQSISPYLRLTVEETGEMVHELTKSVRDMIAEIENQ